MTDTPAPSSDPNFIPIEGVVLVAGFGALCFHLVRKTRRAAR